MTTDGGGVRVPAEPEPGIVQEAGEFIAQCYAELGRGALVARRLEQVRAAVEATGRHDHTPEELRYGARVAWRNSNRCIGRLFWSTLHVIDARHLQTEEAVFEALVHHLRFATNEGSIRPAITVLRPGIRIWNHELISYAGYQVDGRRIGDPLAIELTERCGDLGWKGRRTDFDILPVVIQFPGRRPRWFELPRDVVLEVPLRHPGLSWFQDLGLRWFAVPVIADMYLDLGGIRYTAAPFNGWYMETEIGARDLADSFRYDRLREVAARMGLDTARNASLWKDKALVALNEAVLHSFAADGVKIVDHHTAAEQFERFAQIEGEHGRTVTGDWTWLIPPLSPAATSLFHRDFPNETRKPNYFYHPSKPWAAP